MGFLNPPKQKGPGLAVQTAPKPRAAGFRPQNSLPAELPLYRALRHTVPIIDAALEKIVRLTVDFTVEPRDRRLRERFRVFEETVPVGGSGAGLVTFISRYLDCLLTCGSAVGEMVLSGNRKELLGLYLPPLEHLEVREGATPLEAVLCKGHGKDAVPLPVPELLLFTALGPEPGSLTGQPLLAGLPEISRILLTIYEAVGHNFERLGNLRYAVTYRPAPGDHTDAARAAEEISREWSEAMTAGSCGDIRDFVAVGDVDIKVIGADNQFISTEVPVRQLLEQIVAKLGLPPFLLGLSWSSTERMSTQQSDLLTSELESYRRLLEPAIRKICSLWLRLQGADPAVTIHWGSISLQDETEVASARLTRARAAMLEEKLQNPTKEVEP